MDWGTDDGQGIEGQKADSALVYSEAKDRESDPFNGFFVVCLTKFRRHFLRLRQPFMSIWAWPGRRLGGRCEMID